MIIKFFYALLVIPTTLALHLSNSDTSAVNDAALNGDYSRPLRAARKRQDLSTRGLKGCLSHDHLLHYVDGGNACAAP